jgi:hypothetical protein
MKPAKDGSKLWKRLEVKIIVGEKVMPHVFRAPPKRGYSAADIEESLERVIEHLDAKFPTLEFKQVELARNKFNFIAIGARQNPEVKSDEENASTLADASASSE